MNEYENQLLALLKNPGSFSGTPGYKFALDQGLDGVSRSMSRQRGSGNALAALTKYASGLATQDYGNQVDRLGRLTGQQQQFDLGSEANQNALTLGTRAADTADRRVGYDYELGRGGLDNARRAGDQNFGVSMYRAGNDYDLGSRSADNTAQNNWWNYQLGSDRNANDAAAGENSYNLNMYNAQTNRGRAMSDDWWNPQRQARMPLTRRYV